MGTAASVLAASERVSELVHVRYGHVSACVVCLCVAARLCESLPSARLGAGVAAIGAAG